MELKWILLAVLTILLVRSNCTFMELKCPYSPIRCCESSCSNCTFMELKYVKQRRSVWSEIVLIVPLWNWNKFRVEIFVSVASSNCTFMELKYEHCCQCYHYQNVLIVPLWNWNRVEKVKLLVEPLRSNCTFMELKYPYWLLLGSGEF